MLAFIYSTVYLKKNIFTMEVNWYWSRLPTESQTQLDKALSSLMCLGLLRAGLWGELVGL